MALALYRKYRPATFADVVGQEHVTGPLMTAVDSGRINHAYLFSGPRGCGKTSSARILARSLNCEQGPTSTPCGNCQSCIDLAPDGSGNIDVIEIDAASHGGVDDARELRERAFQLPVHNRYKIYIIDEAHMVSNQGFNALLKVVEEPPESVIFIFATTEPDKVLPTIRSRTHHYPFRLVPPATMRELLERNCASEGVTVGPAVLPLVVRAGGGSVRDSQSLLDQLIAGAGPEGLTYEDALALLGVTDAALLDDMIEAIGVADGATVFGTIHRLIDAGHDPRRFAADLLDRLRDLILIAAVPDAGQKGLIEAPVDQIEKLTDQAGRLGLSTLSRLADIVHVGLTEMRGTTAPRLGLELICARMLLPAVGDDAASMTQRIERLERRMEIGGLPAGESARTGDRPTAVAPARAAAPPADGLTPRQRAQAALEAERSAAGPATAGGSARPSTASSSENQPTPSRGPENQPTPSRGTEPSPEPDTAATDRAPSGAGALPAPTDGDPAAAVAEQKARPPAAPRPTESVSAQPAPVQPAPVQPVPADPPPPRASRPEPHRPEPAQPTPEPTRSTDGQPQAHTATPAQQAARSTAASRPPETAPADEGWPEVVQPGSRASQQPSSGWPEVTPPGSGAASGASTNESPLEVENPRSAGAESPDERPATTDRPDTAPNGVPSASGESAPPSPGTSPEPATAQQPAASQTQKSPAQPDAPIQQTSRPREPATDGGSSSFDIAEVRRQWRSVVDVIKRSSRAGAALVETATPVVVRGSTLVLTAPPALVRRLADPQQHQPLRSALQDVLGVSWAIEVTDNAATPPSAAGQQPSHAEPEDDEHYSPDPDDESVADPRASMDPGQAAVNLLRDELGAEEIADEQY